MTVFAFFLVACAAIFLGTVQTAFSALMRLSLRLMAERGGRSEQLGRYLDDPLYLFIPVRILIGLITVLAAVLIARSSDIQSLKSVTIFMLPLVGKPSSMVATLAPVPAVAVCGVARVKTSLKPRLVGPDAGVPASCSVRKSNPAFKL